MGSLPLPIVLFSLFFSLFLELQCVYFMRCSIVYHDRRDIGNLLQLLTAHVKALDTLRLNDGVHSQFAISGGASQVTMFSYAAVTISAHCDRSFRLVFFCVYQ